MAQHSVTPGLSLITTSVPQPTQPLNNHSDQDWFGSPQQQRNAALPAQKRCAWLPSACMTVIATLLASACSGENASVGSITETEESRAVEPTANPFAPTPDNEASVNTATDTLSNSLTTTTVITTAATASTSADPTSTETNNTISSTNTTATATITDDSTDNTLQSQTTDLSTPSAVAPTQSQLPTESLPSELTPPELSPPESLPPELTPVELLFQEITLTALAPVVRLQRKINSGEPLTIAENNCLGSWEPGLGSAVTTIDCETAQPAGNPGLIVSSAAFHPDDNCQNSIRQADGERCRLVTAMLEFRVEWVPSTTTAIADDKNPDINADSNAAIAGNNANNTSAIASVVPIAGTRIEFDRDRDQVTLAHTSTLTGAFNCHYRISNAREFRTDTSFGNCNAEMSRTINRLNELRSQ